ncbi:hypothetical protein BN871_BQ_00040 [Paenibacillus sp. P22]|nr:hypothetical protein BN871_BQ_00040 [Paenibacillus sp. P22]
MVKSLLLSRIADRMSDKLKNRRALWLRNFIVETSLSPSKRIGGDLASLLFSLQAEQRRPCLVVVLPPSGAEEALPRCCSPSKRSGGGHPNPEKRQRSPLKTDCNPVRGCKSEQSGFNSDWRIGWPPQRSWRFSLRWPPQRSYHFPLRWPPQSSCPFPKETAKAALKPPLQFLLDRPVRNPSENIALKEEEQDDRRNEDDQDAGRDDVELGGIRPNERVDRGGDDLELLARHVQVRRIEIVVDGNRLQDDERRRGRGQQREDDGAVDLEQRSPFHHRALVQVFRNAVDELEIDDDLQHVGADVQKDRSAHRVVQAELLDDGERGDLRRHHRDDLGDEVHAHDRLFQLEVEAAQGVRDHRAEHDVAGDSRNEDDQRVLEAEAEISDIVYFFEVVEVEEVMRQRQGGRLVVLHLGFERADEYRVDREEHDEQGEHDREIFESREQRRAFLLIHGLFPLPEQDFALDDDEDQYDDEQHDRHGRCEAEALILEGRVHGLDDEGLRSVGSEHHDVRNIEGLEGAGQRQQQHEREDAFDAGRGNEAEFLPAGRAVDRCRLVNVPGNGLQGADEDHHVEAHVFPHRDERQRNVDQMRIAEPALLPGIQSDCAQKAVQGSIVEMVHVLEHDDRRDAVQHIRQEQRDAEAVFPLQPSGQDNGEPQGEGHLDQAADEVVGVVLEGVEHLGLGEDLLVVVQAYPVHVPAGAGPVRKAVVDQGNGRIVRECKAEQDRYGQKAEQDQ